ncbi:hypothetical protein GQ53DRAFT_822440 [Thozetella sp. PMI_491]|nr:hypothetical protein GQ53DRAFT_822440 [Thozetella sp. PMI_491]
MASNYPGAYTAACSPHEITAADTSVGVQGSRKPPHSSFLQDNPPTPPCYGYSAQDHPAFVVQATPALQAILDSAIQQHTNYVESAEKAIRVAITARADLELEIAKRTSATFAHEEAALKLAYQKAKMDTLSAFEHECYTVRKRQRMAGEEIIGSTEEGAGLVRFAQKKQSTGIEMSVAELELEAAKAHRAKNSWDERHARANLHKAEYNMERAVAARTRAAQVLEATKDWICVIKAGPVVN